MGQAVGRSKLAKEDLENLRTAREKPMGLSETASMMPSGEGGTVNFPDIANHPRSEKISFTHPVGEVASRQWVKIEVKKGGFL